MRTDRQKPDSHENRQAASLSESERIDDSKPASESRHAVYLIVREYEPDSVRLDRQRA